MTIWKAGMLAVCVDATPARDGTSTRSKLVNGRIYRVRGIKFNSGLVGLLLVGIPVEINRSGSPAGWSASRFRPLNDAEQDADLIAKIKRCKPARQPVEA